jgi:hypothetical protein
MFVDGAKPDFTGMATWTSSNPNVASIDGPSGIVPAKTRAVRRSTHAQGTFFGADGIPFDQDLTIASAWWSSSDPVATLSHAGTHGIATAVRPGMTAVRAHFLGVVGATGLTVTSPRR